MAEQTAHFGALDKIEQILQDHSDPAAGDGHGRISLGELTDGMQERAYGFLLLILALPCGLPFVYILPQIVALPMIMLVFQMASGRSTPWLPENLRARELPISRFLGVVRQAKKFGGWLERLSHARLRWVTGEVGTRVIGALLLIPCVSVLVPLPLTNTTPGIAVAIAAVGLIERDGIFVMLGTLLGLIWVALLVIGGPALLYFLIDWALGQGISTLLWTIGLLIAVPAILYLLARWLRSRR